MKASPVSVSISLHFAACIALGVAAPSARAAVLADINADGTSRSATTADFEDAAGLAAGTFSGDSVHVFADGAALGAGPFSETTNNITLQVSDKTGDADGWFGDGTDNNLLEDGFHNGGTTPQTITLSGSGLGLATNRQYELYLFAGRSQGHDTTFRFDVNDPEDPSGGVGINTDPPVVGGDETLGTALFTLNTGTSTPASLVIEWGEHAPGVDPVFSGFALRDIGPAVPDTTPPAISAISPTNGASGVAAGAELMVTFDEIIETNATGSIVITNLTDHTGITIAIGDTNQVAVNGNTLTINPANALAAGTSYAVLIDTNALKDLAGHFFAGILNATTWMFQTEFDTVAYWQFDNNSNLMPLEALTDSVGTYDLSVVTGAVVSSMTAAVDPVPNPDTTPGFSGDPAANPDPSLVRPSLLLGGDHLEVTSDPGDVFNLSGKNFTFEGWFRHDPGGAIDGFGDLIGGTRNTSPFGGYLVRMLPDGRISAFFANAGGANPTWSIATSGTDYNDDTFHHFALVWEDGVGANGTGFASLYIDGVLEASGSAPADFDAATADANDNAFILGGRSAGGGNHWEGRFDEFRFSRVALPPTKFLSNDAPPAAGTLIIIK